MTRVKGNGLDLTSAVNDLLMQYGDAINDVVADVLPIVAKDTVRMLNSVSPHRTGKYSKGWRVLDWRKSKNYTGVTVHNKDRYQLTHLLELGHARRGGGRVDAYEHIGPVDEWAKNKLLEDVAMKIRGITLK